MPWNLWFQFQRSLRRRSLGAGRTCDEAIPAVRGGVGCIRVLIQPAKMEIPVEQHIEERRRR